MTTQSTFIDEALKQQALLFGSSAAREVIFLLIFMMLCYLTGRKLPKTARDWALIGMKLYTRIRRGRQDVEAVARDYNLTQKAEVEIR